MIIWLNGGFGAGKTTLAQELHRRLPDAGALRERLNARVTQPGKDWDRAAREIGMTGVDEIAAAAARQPAGTLMLRSDRLTPAGLADEVLAAAGSRRVH